MDVSIYFYQIAGRQIHRIWHFWNSMLMGPALSSPVMNTRMPCLKLGFTDVLDRRLVNEIIIGNLRNWAWILGDSPLDYLPPHKIPSRDALGLLCCKTGRRIRSVSMHKVVALCPLRINSQYGNQRPIGPQLALLALGSQLWKISSWRPLSAALYEFRIVHLPCWVQV